MRPWHLNFYFSVKTGETLVVRTCVLEDIASGGVQCGSFRFLANPNNDSHIQVMNGCILTCDYDGCNGANKAKQNWHYYLFLLSFTLMYSNIVR